MRRTKKLLAEILSFPNIPSAADLNPSLKYKREVSVNEAYPRREGLCRRCASPLSGKRTAWCSNACTLDALIRCSASFASKWVRLRDKGICAICGLDTKALKKQFNKVFSSAPKKLRPKVENLLIILGFSKDRSFTEADHLISVYDGGAHCGLENYRELCRPCHSKRTVLQAAERARKRKLEVE